MEIYPFAGTTQFLIHCLSEAATLPTLFCLVAKVQKYLSCTSRRRPKHIVGCSVSSLRHLSLFMALMLSLTLLAALIVVLGQVGTRKSSKDFDVLQLEQQGADWGGRAGC
jgi:hypothetical protein